MTALESIRAALVADAGITAALADRITPINAADGSVFPYATLDTDHVAPQNALGGFAGLDICAVMLEVWAETFTDADAIAFSCRRVLEAAGFQCTGDSQSLRDASFTPGAFMSGWVFRAFQ